MSKNQKKKKSRWVIFIVLLISVVGVGWIGFSVYNQFNNPSEETVEQIKENPPINISNQETILIAEYHAKYNGLTGYGNIEDLDMNDAKRLSAKLEEEMKEIISQGIANQKLADDFKKIHALAEATKNKVDKDQVRLIHRYFHDLDIAVNQYKSKDVFGVTKTLGK